MANDIAAKIVKDIEKKYNKAAKEFAEEITFQIESAYESVIELFYADYDPIYYERTYSTYLASDHYDSLDVEPYSNGYTAGITASSDNIMSALGGNPYRAKNIDWVFDRTYSLGIHGFTHAELRTRQRKRKLIKKWANSNSKLSLKDYVDKGMFQYAALGAFSGKKVKKGRARIMNIPKRMTKKPINVHSDDKGNIFMASNVPYTTAPRPMMNSIFKKITKRKYLDGVWESIANKYFG